MNTARIETTILFDKLSEEHDVTDTVGNQVFGGCYNVILFFLTVSVGGAYVLHHFLGS